MSEPLAWALYIGAFWALVSFACAGGFAFAGYLCNTPNSNGRTTHPFKVRPVAPEAQPNPQIVSGAKILPFKRERISA